jgi:hypothetical protein
MQDAFCFKSLRTVADKLNFAAFCYPQLAFTAYANGTLVGLDRVCKYPHDAIMRKYTHGGDCLVVRVDGSSQPPVGWPVFLFEWMYPENEDVPELAHVQGFALSIACQGEVDLADSNKRRLHLARSFYLSRVRLDAHEARAVGGI